MKYIKNTTLSDKIYLGVTIEPGEYRLIPPNDRVLWANDANVTSDINNGTILVAHTNDGTTDLTPTVGLISLASASTIDTTYVFQTGTVSTSSSSFSTITGMTLTPAAGDYLVFFSAKANTTGVNGKSEYGIYIDNSLVAETKRELSCSVEILGLITLSLNAIGVEARTSTKITVNGSQSINVKYRSVNGVAVSFGERNLTIVRVG